MPDLKPEGLKQLLTAAELKLVESSRQPMLAKLSEAKLKKQIGLTRKARDKWRNQSTRQRREVQRAQGSRVTDAAARSASKEEILTKALDALQDRLDKIGSGAASPGTQAPAPKAPSKESRAKGHRATRADVRASLEDERAKLAAASEAASATKKKVAKKSAVTQSKASKSKASKSKASQSKVSTKTAKKAVKKNPPQRAAKKKVARKKVAAKKKPSVTTVNTAAVSGKKLEQAANKPVSRLNVNPRDQQSSKTKAKKARIEQSGLTTRTRGHVSARGKRAQGRRDRKG